MSVYDCIADPDSKSKVMRPGVVGDSPYVRLRGMGSLIAENLSRLIWFFIAARWALPW